MQQEHKNEPIRILHVVTTMDRGGLETMIMNYYRSIDRTRVQFDFLTHSDHHQDFEEEILALGGVIYRLPRLNPFSISYHKKLNRFFLEHPEYKVVHCHRDCMSGIPLKAAKKAGVPIRIAHSHNSNQTKDAKLPIKLIYMRSIPRNATKLFACSESAGAWMFRGKPFEVLRNAIAADQFQFDSRKAKRMKEAFGVEGQFVIGHVGQFRAQKNHMFLIDVFATILDKHYDSVLLLVGEGSQADRVREKVKELGIGEKVKFLGLRSDIAEIMNAMDVFVLPSFYEGLPVSMIEAQAAGLPCIISDGVPLECQITENVEQVSLSERAEVWAERILNYRNMVRPDNSAIISAAGFDIKTNAHWLEEYYCNAYRS